MSAVSAVISAATACAHGHADEKEDIMSAPWQTLGSDATVPCDCTHITAPNGGSSWWRPRHASVGSIRALAVHKQTASEPDPGGMSTGNGVLLPPSAQAHALMASRDSTTRCWQALLRSVLRAEASKDKFRLSRPSKSSSCAAFNDRFMLTVPLGNSTVEWTLLLNGMRPEHPPDIIFDEDSQDFAAHVQYAELTAIKTWDIERGTALLELLLEVHQRFTAYQHERVHTLCDAQVRFEVDSVLALAPHTQMRVLTDSLSVECVIPIGHEPSSAANQGHPEVPDGGAQAVCRLVLVLEPEMRSARAWLDYPASTPPQQRAQCPLWRAGATHAFDFLPAVEATVQGKLAVRRMCLLFMQQLCRELTPLFVDPLHHKAASFLCQLDASFEAVVHITVPDSFPQDPPSVVLQSVAHLIQRLPVTERLAPMAWSPTWAVADMVAYVINVISKELLLFGKRVLESARAQAPLLARGQ